ncbi:MAG: U32 family peptidase [Oscillospiraceae bacterium]|nr:U32 family peptidase [Oscillospiraceae bacterium]
MHFRIEITTLEQLCDALSCCKAEYVYTPVRLIVGGEGVRSELLPTITPENKSRIIAVPEMFTPEPLHELKQRGYTHVLAHTIGHVQMIKEAGMIPHGSFRLNITNSLALAECAQLGLNDTVMSIEMGLHRVKALKRTIPIGIIAYGKLPLMLLRKIPNSGGLTDRKDKFLPLIKNKSEAELLNPDTLILSDRDLSMFDFAVLKITDEETKEILDMYINGRKPHGEYTRGLYYK